MSLKNNKGTEGSMTAYIATDHQQDFEEWSKLILFKVNLCDGASVEMFTLATIAEKIILLDRNLALIR